MAFITYLDENEYKKKEKALRRYFMKNYKYLVFKFYPTLKKDGKIDGVYQVTLPTSDLFEKVYGAIELHFSVRNDVAILEDITPDRILMDCYEGDIPVYKRIPYRTKKDFKKIKIVEALINGDNRIRSRELS